MKPRQAHTIFGYVFGLFGAVLTISTSHVVAFDCCRSVAILFSCMVICGGVTEADNLMALHGQPAQHLVRTDSL